MYYIRVWKLHIVACDKIVDGAVKAQTDCRNFGGPVDRNIDPFTLISNRFLSLSLHLTFMLSPCLSRYSVKKKPPEISALLIPYRIFDPGRLHNEPC